MAARQTGDETESVRDSGFCRGHEKQLGESRSGLMRFVFMCKKKFKLCTERRPTGPRVTVITVRDRPMCV